MIRITLIEDVDLSAELVVVNLVGVAIIDVFAHNEIQRVGIGEQIELMQDSGELVFGNVSVFGAVEVLEMGLHEHPLVLDLPAEPLNHVLKVLLLLLVQLHVHSSGGQSGLTVDLLHLE